MLLCDGQWSGVCFRYAYRLECDDDTIMQVTAIFEWDQTSNVCENRKVNWFEIPVDTHIRNLYGVWETGIWKVDFFSNHLTITSIFLIREI